MRWPTTVLSNGIQRPLVMLHLSSNAGFSVNVDALVDTGADVTLLSESTATQLGIDLTSAPEYAIGSALGTVASYRTAEVTIELRRKPGVIRWATVVGFVAHRMAYGMLGTRGFFEDFRLTYDAADGFFEIAPKSSLSMR